MWDPFSFDGPKSAERLEDERYVRALYMLETSNFPVVADALGFKTAALKSMIWRINEACDTIDAGGTIRASGRPPVPPELRKSKKGAAR